MVMFSGQECCKGEKKENVTWCGEDASLRDPIKVGTEKCLAVVLVRVFLCLQGPLHFFVAQPFDHNKQQFKSSRQTIEKINSASLFCLFLFVLNHS